MANTTINTIYKNAVSRAIFGKYRTINEFLDDYDEKFRKPGDKRTYHQKVYGWIKRGRVPPGEAKNFVKLLGAKLEEII